MAAQPGIPGEPPAVTMRRMINGVLVTQMIYVAASLKIADLLADHPQTSVELAAATGSHPHSLYRLLRTLASFGIFAEDEQGRFGLTPLADVLRTSIEVGVPDIG